MIGLLAALKALEANQTDSAKDLINAIERALAKADAESVAVSGVLSGIAEGVDVMEKDITKTKDLITTIKEILTGEKVDTSLPKFQFNLKDYFPFCIPFDLIDFIGVLNAAPEAPSFEWRFKVDSIGLDYTMEVDFSEFDEAAQIFRTMMLLLFVIGLIMATRDLIRG